ncbi:MAG: VWA domain-containing protein [Acidobacteriota bacterium]
MRPYRESSGTTPEIGRVTTAHIMLLDQSMSMGYRDRWAQAKKAASEILQNAAEGDRFALLGFTDRTIARTELTDDPAEATHQLENVLEPTDHPTRYGQALKSAERIALDAGTGKRVIYIISDFQRNGWASEERATRLSAGIDLKPIDVGSKEYSNLAFRDVHVFEAGRTGGRGMRIQCSVIHYGNGELRQSKVHFSIDDRRVETRPVDLAAGETRAVEFSIPELTEGSHLVLLEIEDPALVQDNRFYMTVESGSRIPVLAVESPTERGQRSPSFFLEKALNIDTLSPFQMKVVSPDALVISGELLIWNNAPGGAPALQEKLQRFVEDGGGLAIVMADSSRAADFNRSFGSWLPVRMTGADSRERSTGSRPIEDYVLMTDVQMDHPIFQPFSQPHSGAFSSARFFLHARLSVDSGVDIPARFDSGDPALVSTQVGRGRVLVFASSADDETNDLPLKAVYAPLWQQMLKYLGNHQEKRYWLEVGDVLNPGERLQDSLSGQEKERLDSGEAVAVLGPDKKRLQMAPGSDRLLVGESGFYEIRSMNRNRTVAVNTVPKESDLSPGNAEEMTAGWVSTESAVFEAETQAVPEDQGRRQRIWVLLFISALLLEAAELFLADRGMDQRVKSSV